MSVACRRTALSQGDMDRILARFEVTENGCWLWSAGKTKGYATMSIGWKTYYVHRLTFEHFRKSVPEGLELDHLCRRRHCVNPWHLEIVTQKENILRGVSFSAINAKKTHCKRGHEFTEENTRFRIRDGSVRRSCRECDRSYIRTRRAAKRGEAVSPSGSRVA